MKHLTIILLLIFISCKNEPKAETESQIELETLVETENKIDKSVLDMWNNFTESNPEYKKEEQPNTDFFDNSEKEPNKFAELIVNGKKRASSGLYIWYKDANVDLPKIGTKLIVTDFNGKARAIIETEKVDTIPFNKVSKEYATLDMGTTIEPLKKWKKAHWEFFANALEQNKQKPIEEMLVVCEWFKTIWPKNTNTSKN